MPDSSHVEAPTLTSNGLIYPAPEATGLVSEILAQLTEGVVTLADDDSVVSWNPGAASLTGYIFMVLPCLDAATSLVTG